METERTVYVIYAPGHGFGKGTGSYNVAWEPCFTKARVFRGANHAKTSGIYKSAKRTKMEALIIPVKLILDPESLFEAILSGESK